jgi:peptide subunit release factor 1 (eRF1)
VLRQEVIDRLLRFRSAEAPVLSVYVAIPADPGELRGVETHFNSTLKPVRELAESGELSHAQRESLRADVNQVMAVAARARSIKGRAVGIFACKTAGLYEEVDLPRRVRDRAVVDEVPYLRPLLAVLDEAHRYCAVVVDRERAWLYEFYMGDLEEAKKVRGWALRKREFGGWYGLQESRVRNRAHELARRHFRETAALTEEVVETTGAELLIVGGHQETVKEFLPFLPRELPAKLAGTFIVDPHTMTPGRLRERTEQVVNEYERNEEARLVGEVLERLAAGGLAAAGVEWCLLAVDEHAVQLLLVDDDEQVPGRVCDNCGWLGLQGEDCPVCGQHTRKAPDVIDEVAAAVLDSGGRVQHVYADTDLAAHVLAAFLRFPVPKPVGAPTT